MKAQVRYETQGRATRAGERRGAWQRFSTAATVLFGGLLCATLFFSATGQALADQPGRKTGSPGLWALLSAQTREVVAQSRHFVNDVRLIYQISQLAPMETESVATPRVAPAEPECKLISAPGRTVALVKLSKARL